MFGDARSACHTNYPRPSEAEGRVSFVRGWKDMTIYSDSNLSSDNLVGLLKHEIAHLLGIGDKYDTEFDENGVRVRSYPRLGWEDNIAAIIGGKVDSRNFMEANNTYGINKKIFKF